MNQQEYFLKLQMLEQQANHLEEQLHLINQQIEELNKLKDNLKSLEKSKEKESFSEFGKGIYLKSLIEKKEFLVDIGANVLVPKTSKEIGDIIDDQVEKLEKVKLEIGVQIEHINLELDKITKLIQEEKLNPSLDKDKAKGKKEKN